MIFLFKIMSLENFETIIFLKIQVEINFLNFLMIFLMNIFFSLLNANLNEDT